MKSKKLVSMGAVALVALVIFAVPRTSKASFRILLTSFDPFGGSSANNTQAIVANLAQMAAILGTDVEVKSCNLPVVYDAGAKAAMDCVAQIQPNAVVSFGEADCSVQIESAATNWDGTEDYPDNAGQVRNGSQITANGPQRSGFDFPVPAMYCAIGNETARASVVVSSSPGAFVCNNTAYHLSQELEPKGIPFTFIHVPNTQCSDAQVDPAGNAATIAHMLQAAIVQLRAETQVLMPKTQAEATGFLQDLQSKNAPACQIEYVQRLISSY